MSQDAMAMPMPALQSLAQRAHIHILTLENFLASTTPSSPSEASSSSSLATLLLPLVERVREIASALYGIHARLSTTLVASPPTRQSVSECLAASEEVSEMVLAGLKRMAMGEWEDGRERERVVGKIEVGLEGTMRGLAVVLEILEVTDEIDQNGIWAENSNVMDERRKQVGELKSELAPQLSQATPSTETIPRKAFAKVDDNPTSQDHDDALPSYDSVVSQPPVVPPEMPAPAQKAAAQKAPQKEAKQQPQQKPPPSPAKSGFSSFFKSITALPSLLRRVEPLVSTLCQAATQGDAAVVTRVLSEGASIEGLNEDGHTALICAVLADKLDVVRLLLDKGASLATKDGSSKVIPPLFHAAEAGNLPVATLLLNRGADPNARGSFGQPFLVGAAKDAPVEAVRLLLQRGGDPNTCSLTGKSIISQGVYRGRVELVRILLDQGADASSRTTSGQPLLGMAVSNGDLEMTQLLVERGASVNSDAIFEGSVLALAAEKGSLEVVHYLLKQGADPDGRDSKSTHVLAASLKRDQRSVVELLLAYGANVGVSSTSDKSLLTCAIDRGRVDQIRLLLAHGANPNTNDRGIIMQVLRSSTPNAREMLELLLAHGANPDKCGSSWPAVTNYPLGYCAQKDKLSEMALLLKARANPNNQYDKDTTPFMYAVAQGRLDAARLMAGFGANANTRDRNGDGALALAIRGGDVDMVRLVLERGAAVYEGERSQVALARKMGKREVVKLLEEWVDGKNGPKREK